MKILTPNYWVRGTGAGSISEIKIPRTETVAALKKAIKNEDPVTFRDVDADDPLLCKPRDPVPRPYKENLSKIVLSEHAECLSEMALDGLSKVFPEPPPKRHIHIIVDAPYLMIVCWLRGAALNAGSQASIRADATMSELKHRIREKRSNLINVSEEYIRLYRISGDDNELRESLIKTGDGEPLQGGTLLPNFLDDRTTLLPQAATLSEYVKLQSGDQRFLDCRCVANDPLNTVAPPVQLFNPAFAYFTSNAFDPDYDVPDDFVLDVRDLVVEFTLIYPSEDARRRRLKSSLRKAICHPSMFIDNSDRTAPDVGALSSCRELPVYLIIDEEKNGDGGLADPSVQASFSFLHALRQEENSELLMKCCYPTFIIAHAGPWLTIMGGIFTANCIVQRLTDFLWVPAHPTHDDDQCRRIARVLYALRGSIQRLDLWYKTIEDVIPYNLSAPVINHPRFFPSPNAYRYDGVPVKFAYQEPLEQNVSCVTYLAKTIEDNPKDIVVKFVTSYGADAHREMASTGFAPQLLYYGSIDVTPDMPSYGNLRMIVMEYVKGLTFEDALRQSDISRRLKDDLRRALEQLHGAGYVFGDLRQPNVIVTPERPSTVQLIDLDWAGKEGEVKYPVSISSSIDWPKGVHGLAPI